MPGAATLFDATSHQGIIMGGSPKVLINFLPAARVTDKHICLLPPTAGPHPPSTILQGSTSVLIGGQPAARIGDKVGCDAVITTGSLDVLIGG
jgi:uncharacterized Zn-binding protein involved in type VI secretion